MPAAVRYDNIGYMTEAPILICYDGSEGAKRAIDAAAALLGPRRAIVVDIGPVLTAEESLAVLAPVWPAEIFDQQNTEEALLAAREGVEHARSAGFEAEARAAGSVL
jgi:nucleotide-binding universal stress UspA family protein